MDAGQLDQLIAIEQPTITTDALGQEVEDWAVTSQPWAKLMETPGREFLAGDYRAGAKAVFQIRFRSIDSTARVAWGGRTWRIEAVTGTRRQGYCWLHCEAS